MAEHDDVIDALIRYLNYQEGCDPHWARAVRALVAERDELTARVKNLKAVNSTYVKIVSERDALRQRVAELEAALKPSDRDLRERRYTMQRWMNHVTGMLCQSTHSHDAKQELVTRCDTAIAAMWKEESDGK